MRIKILWISTTPPLKRIAHAGAQTFRYYFEHFVSDDYFEVKLVSLPDGINRDDLEKDLETVDHRIAYKDESIKGKFDKLLSIPSRINPWTKYSGLIYSDYAKRILREVKAYKDEEFIPDFIILEWTSMLIMIDDIKGIFPSSKIVASEHDVTFIGWSRKCITHRGLSKIYWTEKTKNEKKNELRALSMCELVLPHNPDNCKVLMENGINENAIQWLVPYFNDMSKVIRKPNHRDILFFGAMARPENYLSAMWFIENVLPLLSGLAIRFVILGSNPPDELKNYESPSIHITGFVESIEPFFEDSMCLVAPLVLGAGIKVKILEALSSGIPVLTNDIGIEGIPARPGYEYFHCCKAEDYSNVIKRIYDGSADVKKIEGNARDFMKQYCLDDSLLHYQNRLKELRGTL